MAREGGLKYAISLPLEPAVEENIQKLIAYADENLDFYIKRWQARAVKKKRSGWLRWWWNWFSDERILKEIESEIYFMGYDYIAEYACPMEVCPSTRDALQSLIEVSAYYRESGQTGFAYNERYIVEYIAQGAPKPPDHERL